MLTGFSISSACRRVAVAALLLASLPGFGARGGDLPAVTIPLEPLGFPGPSPNHQMAGLALNSVDYVDQNHILVTFTIHALLERIPNDPPTDNDRKVAAVLMELSSGKVLARTEWRLHDYGQYLWALGQGRFLLRLRNLLTVIEPMQHLSKAPFAQQTLVNVSDDLIITDVSVSEDHGLLTLQTQPRSEVEARSTSTGPTARPALALPEASVLVRFIRLIPPLTADSPMTVRIDSGMWRRGSAAFSMNAAGYIERTQKDSFEWDFRYRDYTGKAVPAGGYDTSCDPFAIFVSRSEFVSFGCRGSDAKSMLVGLNVKDQVMWQINLNEPQVFSGLSTAPAGGRFAISRGLGDDIFAAPSRPGQIITQEVRVMQAYNGKMLLQSAASPVQSDGGNFALSPDGMELAVIQDNAVKIYRLPALSTEDKKQVAAERAMDPPIDLTAKAGFVPSTETGGAPTPPEDLKLPDLPGMPSTSGVPAGNSP